MTIPNSSSESNNTSETFTNDNKKNSNEQIDADTKKDSMIEEVPERKFFIDLLEHINENDSKLTLKSRNSFFMSNSNNRINYLKSKIEKSPNRYKIDDWTQGRTNREKVINLVSLFSERFGFRATGNIAKYECLKIAISKSCWEQISETLEVIETIPHVEKTWIVPILAILSKYYELKASNEKSNSSNERKWSFYDSNNSKPVKTNNVRNEVSNRSPIPQGRRVAASSSLQTTNTQPSPSYQTINYHNYYGGYGNRHHRHHRPNGLYLSTGNLMCDDDDYYSGPHLHLSMGMGMGMGMGSSCHSSSSGFGIGFF